MSSFVDSVYKELWEKKGKKPPLLNEINMENNVDFSVWWKWLTYEPEFEKTLIQTLMKKDVVNISLEEQEKLKKYQERMKIIQLIKKYEKDFDFGEYKVINNFLKTESIEELMLDKLSEKEKVYARLEIEHLSYLPNEELEKKIKEEQKPECYENLPMVELYILYRITKITFARAQGEMIKAASNAIWEKGISRTPHCNPLMQ